MARLPRLSLPGLPHHVLLRGNNGQPVFVDDVDRREWLDALTAYAAECGVALHAWVLLPQAAQLLLTPAGRDSLSRFMQAVGRKYTRQFNLRHGRTGTLWEGRYRSTVLQPERYLIPCMVSMDTLPVREGLVTEAQAYEWSSHQHHVGRQTDRRLVAHPVYWQLGNTPFAREAAYAARVAEGVSAADLQALGQATQHGWVLGDAGFVQSLQPRAPRRLARAPAGRPPGSRKGAPQGD